MGHPLILLLFVVVLVSGVGPLRFLDPVPKEYAAGTMDATQRGPICMQDNSFFDVEAGGGAYWMAAIFSMAGDTGMSEDCLHLNVYTPATPAVDNKPRPVLFFIHGGAFVIGNMHGYDARVLANEADAVVVLIQYRLGIFGFYSAGAGGNWGLKDQTLALKWVQGAQQTGATNNAHALKREKNCKNKSKKKYTRARTHTHTHT